MIIDNNIEAVKKCTAFFTIARENGENNRQPIDCSYSCPYFQRLNDDHPEIGRCAYREKTLSEILTKTDGEPEYDLPRDPAEVRATREVTEAWDATMQAAANTIMGLAAVGDDSMFEAVKSFQHKVLGNSDFDGVAFRRWLTHPFSGKNYKEKLKEKIAAEEKRYKKLIADEGWLQP